MASSLAAQLAEAEAKLDGVQSKLDQLEELKAMEATLISQKEKMTDKVAQLRKQVEDEKSEQAFFQKDAPQDNQDSTPAQQSKEEAPVDPQTERKNKLRALNKKLQQIEKLKAKGGALDPDAAAKVASEQEVRRMVAALERGEDYKETEEEPVQSQQDPKSQEKPLPTDPTEREKRVRALKKKLQEITNLKGRDGELDAEATAKLESEQVFLQELAALEAGKDVFIYDEGAAITAKKIEVEKRVKKLQKKLEDIQNLKNKGTELDADARAKVESEAKLKKEVHLLQEQVGQLNKQERERVARRLGWEEELDAQKADEKLAKKAKSKAKSVAAGA